ncbi:hypothetical protein CANCADRAFT_16741, partial [Tortispora caseinolytica NRRL Y-17796]
YPHLRKTWYLVAAAALSVSNRPEDVPILFKYALEHEAGSDQAAQKEIADRLREAILKSGALGGIPKTINSLMRLKDATPAHLRQEKPIRTERSAEENYRIGKEFFDRVYTKISNRVFTQMSTSYPDLAQYVIPHAYGALLSFTGILTAKETSLVIIASLVPQDVNPQLKGHLKGALNNGASKEETMSARALALDITTSSGITLSTPPAKL